MDGTIIDSSLEKYGPHSFRIGIGEVIRGTCYHTYVTTLIIKGWEESILGMSIGERAIITIDYDYAFGEQGYPSVIPPKAQLITEVHCNKRIFFKILFRLNC